LFVIPVSNNSIAGYVAASGKTVFVPDVDNIPSEYPFSFNRAFDLKSGFRTRNMMAFPLTTAEGRIIGVVQLINAMGKGPDGTKQPVPFDKAFEGFVGPANLIVS